MRNPHVTLLAIVTIALLGIGLSGCSESDAVGDTPELETDGSTYGDSVDATDTPQASDPCETLSVGDSCDLDGDPCTLDVCNGELRCEATGDFEDCAEVNEQYPCWTYVCNGKAGCVASNFVEGLSCDDGVPCTQNDTCTLNNMGQETCLGTPIPVDDANPCTDDACVDGVVSHTPIAGAPCPLVGSCGDEGACDDQGICVADTSCPCTMDSDCDDGDPCNGAETCEPGLGCMVGEWPPDDDGLACTDVKCDPETGEISHVPHDQLCEPEGLCGEGVCDLEQGCITVSISECCGNGVIEAGETCDDGNDVDGDGCTVACESENTFVPLGPNIQITANAAHLSMARFDDEHSATLYASAESSDVDPDHYRIVIHKRVGKDLTWVGDWYFDQALTPWSSTQAVEVFSAIGPNHLIAILITPGYERVLNTYKWDGGESLELLSSSVMTEGKGFLGGHPVDDTRFILRYRYDNSGEPVTYQVITRDGDALSFGPEMVRPGPEMFPGLSSNIAQAEPILMRTGATSFREIRPGYVWDPGHLASYTLEVNGNELSWSAPVVHSNTGNRTMEPYVAADGVGGGVVAYNLYDDSMWEWAHYSPGSDSLGVEGSLFAGSNIYRQGVFDSADGYVGGAYFLRERSGNLFRFAQQDNGLWDATPLESDLTNQGCAAAPHIIRVGTLGLFLTCAQAGATAYLRVVDLYTSCGDSVADPGEACDDGNNDNGDGCSSTCTL